MFALGRYYKLFQGKSLTMCVPRQITWQTIGPVDPRNRQQSSQVCRRAALLSLLLAALSSHAFPQAEQGTITGKITDQSGSPVAHADVTATEQSTKVSRQVKSNSTGNYTIPYLPRGDYSVSAESSGFARTLVNNVHLTVGLTATIDIGLKIGQLTQQVDVSASSVLLETQTSSLGTTVERQQIIQMPLLGRNPYSLQNLAPGVMSTSAGNITSGGRASTDEFQLDGGEQRNSTTGGVAYTPPLESVGEFKTITNNFSAEYGRSGGGVVTATTQAGTNDYHGSVYEFLRNDKLNANGWNNNRLGLSRSAFHANQYGFSLGGPVTVPKLYNGRDKTFFFVNFEEYPQRTPAPISDSLPTLAERGGDFSQTIGSDGNLIKIYDPTTTQPVAGQPGVYTRTQFPNNIIPSNRLNPIALNLLNYYPTPNAPGIIQNYRLNRTDATASDSLAFRVDQNLSDKQKLFFRFGRNMSDSQISPTLNIAYPLDAAGGPISTENVTGVLSDTVVFTPSLVGEFRVNFVRFVQATSPLSVGFDASSLGLPASIYNASVTKLFPTINVSDIAALGPDRASDFRDVEGNQEAQGALTWVKRSHTIKTGFDYMFPYFNIFRPNWPSGNYSFGRDYTQGPNPAVSGADTGFGLASMLLGVPDGGNFSIDPSYAASQKDYSWYLEDDWKVRSNFTMNLGVRWEYQTPWTDRFNQLAYFNPTTPDPITGTQGVLQFAGRNGNPRTQTDPQYNNWAPRVGFAWSPQKDTAIRAGYGIFYFPGSGGIGGGIGDLGTGYQTDTPLFLGNPSPAPNTPSPGGSLNNPFVGGLVTPPNLSVGTGLYTFLRNAVSPLSQQWNFSIQRRLPDNTLLQVAYAGTRGEHIWMNQLIDGPPVSALALGTGLNTLVSNPFYGQITTGPLSTQAVAQSQLLRPYPQYTDITQARDPIGDSIYHALMVSLKHQFSHGLQFEASYTFSKEIDDVWERFALRATTIVNPYDLGLSRSISEWDRPNYLVLNYIYQLPFGPGKRWLANGLGAKLLGNWQVSGITTLTSGLPIVITSPNNTFLPDYGAQALRLGSGTLNGQTQTPQHWFNTADFAPAPPYSFGTDSRTEPNLRGPALYNFDISIQREQRFKERWNIVFRGDLFNAFNNAELGTPDGGVTSATFGQILSSGQARNIQFGIRLSF